LAAIDAIVAIDALQQIACFDPALLQLMLPFCNQLPLVLVALSFC
jgi:hypothetical protein